MEGERISKKRRDLGREQAENTGARVRGNRKGEQVGIRER